MKMEEEKNLQILKATKQPKQKTHFTNYLFLHATQNIKLFLIATTVECFSIPTAEVNYMKGHANKCPKGNK
jgi:hypothetical protein